MSASAARRRARSPGTGRRLRSWAKALQFSLPGGFDEVDAAQKVENDGAIPHPGLDGADLQTFIRAGRRSRGAPGQVHRPDHVNEIDEAVGRTLIEVRIPRLSYADFAPDVSDGRAKACTDESPGRPRATRSPSRPGDPQAVRHLELRLGDGLRGSIDVADTAMVDEQVPGIPSDPLPWKPADSRPQMSLRSAALQGDQAIAGDRGARSVDETTSSPSSRESLSEWRYASGLGELSEGGGTPYLPGPILEGGDGFT